MLITAKNKNNKIRPCRCRADFVVYENHDAEIASAALFVFSITTLTYSIPERSISAAQAAEIRSPLTASGTAGGQDPVGMAQILPATSETFTVSQGQKWAFSHAHDRAILRIGVPNPLYFLCLRQIFLFL